MDARDIDEYETESDEHLYSSDDEAVYEQLDHAYHWIISLSQQREYLQELAECKVCHSQLEVTEERSCRAGLEQSSISSVMVPTVALRYSCFFPSTLLLSTMLVVCCDFLFVILCLGMS